MTTKSSPPWLGRVTSKIVIAALVRTKHKEKEDATEKVPSPRYSFLLSIFIRFFTTRIYKISKPLFSFLARPHYPTFILLFGLYFCLWHPGLDNRFIPQTLPKQVSHQKLRLEDRPHIYPTQSVYLTINQGTRWLELFMKDKKVISCPIHISGVPLGQYKILQIQESGEGEIVVLLGSLATIQSRTKIFLASSLLPLEGQACIQVQDDFWEILHPYLRLDNPVFVR